MFNAPFVSRRQAMFMSAALVVGAATGSQAEDKAAGPREPIGDGGTIRLMINPSGTMSFPPFVMKKFGLDKKYGFNLEVVPYTNANTVTAAIQSKNAEVIVFDWLATARLSEAGLRLVGICPFLTYVNSVIVPVDSPIKTLADLKGKKLGVHGKTAFDWIIMQTAARRLYNMDLSKEVSIQEAAAPLLRGSLEQGQLDATQMWNSLAPDILASGKFKTMLTIREITEQLGVPTVPYLLFGMREDYAGDRPNNARAFTAAYREVVDIMKANDEIWIDRGQEMKLSPQGILLFRDEARADILRTFTPEMSDGINKTFALIAETLGAEVMGFKKVPQDMLSLAYQ